MIQEVVTFPVVLVEPMKGIGPAKSHGSWRLKDGFLLLVHPLYAPQRGLFYVSNNTILMLLLSYLWPLLIHQDLSDVTCYLEGDFLALVKTILYQATVNWFSPFFFYLWKA